MPKRARKVDKRDGNAEEKPHPGLTLGNFVPSQYSQALVGNAKSNSNVGLQTNGTPICRANEGATSTFSSATTYTTAKPEQQPEKITSDYKVMRTKKGGLPVSTESRASGKKVTLIHGVSGDAKSLVQNLKCSLGTGGLVTPDGNIELQGDLLHRVERYLKEHREILIPYKKKE